MVKGAFLLGRLFVASGFLRVADSYTIRAMGDTNITSHGQKGGITAHTVNSSTHTTSAPAKEPWWARWGTIATIVATVLAALTFYLTVF